MKLGAAGDISHGAVELAGPAILVGVAGRKRTGMPKRLAFDEADALFGNRTEVQFALNPRGESDGVGILRLFPLCERRNG